MRGLSLLAIKAAREVLAGVIHKTPLHFSHTFSRLTGSDVFVKCENLQRSGSFKLRGAYVKIARLTAKERRKGVVAASLLASLEKGRPIPLKQVETIADGISVRKPGKLTFPLIQRSVDGIAAVDDDEIASTILLLLERSKLLVEGARAVGLAALLISVEHDRLDPRMPINRVEVYLTVETRDTSHGAQLLEALREKGYEVRIGPGG